MTENAKWVLEISVAFICAAFIYQYISFKINFKQELKEWQRKEDEKQMNQLLTSGELTTNSSTESSLDEILGKINEMFEQGFMVGLDASLLSKYPQITEYLNHDNILITEEVAKYARKENNVVGIHHFRGSASEESDTLKVTSVNDSYVQKIGLDSRMISDRAIGAYLYAEKTNLINVKFATMDQTSFEKANLVGLRVVLL